MPCGFLIDKSGRRLGFMCSRGGGQTKAQLCYKCGKPATKLCDYRNGFETCDKPMCSECANHVGKDTDYCEEHNNEFSKLHTDSENRRLGFSGEEGIP